MDKITELYPCSGILLWEDFIPATGCQEVIDFFKANKKQAFPGKTLSGVFPKVKTSLDFRVPSQVPMDDYLSQQIAKRGFPALQKSYPAFFANPHLDTGYQLQFYPKGQGFYTWHVDVSPVEDRRAAAILYLNTVDEGGETEFKHQRVKVKPKAGNLLLFPVGELHVHRGNTPLSGDKMIVTTFAVRN